jgi:SH3-like domain-containing protein
MRKLVVCLMLAGAVADAQPARHTTEQVTLRKKPGEKEAAVATLAANTTVIVLAEEGRWLKVKAGGSVGYVTRTTVSEPDVAAAPPPTAAAPSTWSAARHADGQEITDLFVEAPSATTLGIEPTPTAAKVADVAKGAKLVVLDATTAPGWVRARDSEGHEGWIRRAQLDNSATTAVVAGVDLQGTVETYNRPPVQPLAIRAAFGIGYRSLGMDLSSNAEGGLTNYLVDADAVAETLDVDATMRLGGDWFVAGDARVSASQASPGIDYPGPTAPPGKIPFTTFAADAGVRAGLRVKDAIDLALRAGGHYDAFLPDSVDNAGMLPRERLLGVTVGARAELEPPHSRFAATLRFDYLVVGSRAQTPGLEDGTDSSAHALFGGLVVRYQLARHVAPFAGYDFGRATTAWTGMSVREPGVSETHRTDTVQLIQIGVAAEL